MEKQYDNSNSGALFKNDKEGNEKRPDYRGTLDVDGVEYELSAWLRTSKKGVKFMSLKVREKTLGPAVTAKPSSLKPPADEPDDALPW